MPRYLVVRRFDCEETEMPEVGSRSRRLVDEKYPSITWEHSHVVVDDQGAVSTYCIYAAPSEQVVREHSDDLGRHTVESIHEIAGDVTPADFPG
jgi:hypothetical protein